MCIIKTDVCVFRTNIVYTFDLEYTTQLAWVFFMSSINVIANCLSVLC